jgi:hypothetical protein
MVKKSTHADFYNKFYLCCFGIDNRLKDEVRIRLEPRRNDNLTHVSGQP